MKRPSTNCSNPLQSLCRGWLATFAVLSCLGAHQAPAGVVRFKQVSQTFSEGVGIAFIGLERTTAEGGTAVTIQTVAQSATAGVDFHPVVTTYNFQAGETDVSLVVQIFDNPQFQADRQFKVTLSNPVNVTIGSPAEIAVTIADNDELTVAGRGAAGTNTSQGAYALATNSTGALVVGGLFRTFNGALRNHLVRLQPNGALDPGFAGAGADARIWALATLGDDRTLIAGDFQNFDGAARSRVARVQVNGANDASFTPGTGADARINSLHVLTDQRILIAGTFGTYNGTPRSDVAILSSNGALDPSFNATTPSSFFGYVARPHTAGFVVGGAGTDALNSLMRFDAAGTRDATFQVSVGDVFQNLVSDIVVQPNNQIVLCGNFLGINGQPTGSATVARLNANGSLDTTFNVGSGANEWVFRIARLTDGKFLIAGFFTSFNGVPRAGLARLNENGSLDLNFAPESGANDAVYHALPLADGGILVGGAFSQFDGYDRFCLAQLNSAGTPKLAPVRVLESSLALGPALKLNLAVEPGRDFRLLSSDTLGAWSPVVTNRTARRSYELTLPASFPKEFFQIEQGFASP